LLLLDTMLLKVRSHILAYKKFMMAHKWLTLGVPAAAVVSVLAVIISSTLVIDSYGKYILAPNTSRHMAIGIVLGAGVTKSGKPFRELQARLDVAAAAIQQGTVDSLILSGDNSVKTYDEPGAMMRYLTDVKHISKAKLQPDYAGRSTYESCERASKIFGLGQTIIFSAASHLLRAIYLCRHFGIESYGMASHIEANNSGRREVLARVKAFYNVYIRGEKTILGAPISIPHY
jgi:vancomycin permeability regulator SanA